MSKSLEQQVIDESVRVESARGVSIEVVQHFESMDYIINVRKGNKSLSHRVAQIDWTTTPSLIARDIGRAVDALLSSRIDESRRVAELENELRKYKDAVKQLAFELEMAQGNSRGADTVARVAEIRRLALEQASDYVMDFGIPRSGAELERLCNEIKGLKETKDMAMARAASAMNKFFTNAAEVPF